jgi:L-ribulose-5-phosphate 3-epimerase UlaE
MSKQIKKLIKEELLKENINSKDELLYTLNIALQHIDECYEYVKRFDWSQTTAKRLMSMATELEKTIRSLSASNNRSFDKK